MSKTFSDEEIRIIKAQLIEKGIELFGKQGIRRTSIDELIKGVGIAKGTFYKFYDSKEHLFMDVLQKIEVDLSQELTKVMNQENKPFKELFKLFFKFQFDIAESHPIIQILLQEGEMSQLYRKVSVEALMKSRGFQNNFLLKFIREGQEKRLLINKDSKILLALFQAVIMMCNYRDYIGESYHQMIELLIEILADYLVVEMKSSQG
ncbi:MAG: TetR/AcrR family transcriptional regulator [Candidatus Hodarchaeota archaeon]